MIELSTDVVVEKGANYIRYDGGLQICFGEVRLTSGLAKGVIFPVPFKDDSSVFITLTPYWNVTDLRINNTYPTNFYVNLNVTTGEDALINYIAIGWWK